MTRIRTPEQRARALEKSKLPAGVRIAILTRRLQNLIDGSGEYPSKRNREMAIIDCENALDDAEADAWKEGRA